MPKPFRRYATGSVYRNEKPGPGRFRQFTQFDADTVGAESVAADAEMCMLAADTMEALGFERGQYVIKVGSRKLLDGALETIRLSGPESSAKRLIVLRALDKLDRLGSQGVRQLLGAGRKDESGDFTPGAGLEPEAVTTLFDFVGGEADAWIAWHPDQLPTDDELCRKGKDLFGHREDGKDAWSKDFYPDQDKLLNLWMSTLSNSSIGHEGVMELRNMLDYFRACGYGTNRIQISSSVVRGLEYYTGPVFEAELLIPATDDKGNPVRFGSVGGGGRYDDLVARFTGQKVPATGFSIGVSRLQAALNLIGRAP
jgi:histidyl-tRNA synthetase